MKGRTPKKGNQNPSFCFSINNDGTINVRANLMDPILFNHLASFNSNAIMNSQYFNALTNRLLNFNNTQVPAASTRFDNIDLN